MAVRASGFPLGLFRFAGFLFSSPDSLVSSVLVPVSQESSCSAISVSLFPRLPIRFPVSFQFHVPISRFYPFFRSISLFAFRSSEAACGYSGSLQPFSRRVPFFSWASRFPLGSFRFPEGSVPRSLLPGFTPWQLSVPRGFCSAVPVPGFPLTLTASQRVPFPGSGFRVAP